MKLAYSIEETSKMVGLGKTRLYQHINEGTLRARKIGRRTLVLSEDLLDFLQTMEKYDRRK